MWRKLDRAKRLLDFILLAIAVTSALVGFFSSLSIFESGFALGAFVAALPMIAVRLFSVFRPELTIGSARRIAMQFLTREGGNGTKYFSFEKLELKEKKWEIHGTYSFVIPAGSPIPAEAWKTVFTLSLDSQTGNVLKWEQNQVRIEQNR